MIALGLIAVVFLWAFSATVFTGVAISAVRRVHAAAARAVFAVSREGRWPKIAILRPCEGLDPNLEANLLASATARYDGPREVWVCVPDESDPAFGVAERARAEAARLAPSVRFEVLVTRIETAQNRKAAHLGVAEARADAPLLVIADSDVHLEEDSLPALIAALEADPQAGAAFAPPYDIAPETLGDQASAALLSSTPHALLALAALSHHSQSQTLLAGALLACRRDVLESVGGFASLEPYLGEDFELARRFHEIGRPVRVSSVAARFTDRGRTTRGIIDRYARWSLVVRRQRPWLFSTYFLLLGCTPALVLSAVACVVLPTPFAPLPLLATGVLVALRTGLALALRRRYGISGGVVRALFAMLLGESLIFASATQALFSSRIVWRGRPFRVGNRGQLEAISA